MRRLLAPHTLILLRLSLLAVVVFAGAEGAKALPKEAEDGFSKNASKTFAAGAPDPRVPSSPLIEREDSNEDRSGNDIPVPAKPNIDIKIPAVAGFEQIANMKPMKEVLKRMITADVPVMFQTMMMVENGAATGYIGSMNTVGSLLSNTIQASQHQMELLRAMDPTGGKERDYVDSAYISLTQKNQKSWPAALWFASGDKVVEAPQKFDQFQKNDNPTGSNVADETKTQAEQQPGTGPKNEVKLSSVLFRPLMNPSSAEAAWAEYDLSEAFLDWVGDMKTTQEQTAEYASRTLPEPQLARKFQNRSTTGSDEEQPANVYELFQQETVKEVWKHLHEVLKTYCEFKQKKDNYSKQIFEKKKPSEAISEKKESWEKIHSMDIKPSINLIDQLFKLFMGRRNIEEVKCGQTFKGDESTLPTKASAAEASGSTFDSCEDNPKECLRNAVLYRITKFIAESQVNYYYRWMWEALYPRLSHPAHQEELEALFCKNLGLGWPCDPGTEFSMRIDINRVSWIEFSNRLSKFAQGQGGATVFKPSADMSTLGAAGSVAMGNGSGGK
jgi:hypothetical protein